MSWSRVYKDMVNPSYNGAGCIATIGLGHQVVSKLRKRRKFSDTYFTYRVS